MEDGTASDNGAKTQPRPVVIGYRAIRRVQRAEASSIAAEAAYFSILAIAPFFIFLIASISIVSQTANVSLVGELEDVVRRMAPGQTGELLASLFEGAVERADRGALSFGLLSSAAVAMWSASRAIQALLRGFNRVYQIEQERPPIWARTISLLLAVVLVTLITVSATMLLFGGALGRWAATALGLGSVFARLWPILNWPIAAVILIVMLSLLYSIGPNTEVRGGIPSIGALVATGLWLVIMAGLRIYIWLVQPGTIYGALSAFVLLVVFFYVTAIALLIGAAVNAIIDENDTAGAHAAINDSAGAEAATTD
jgi:membrane protein